MAWPKQERGKEERSARETGVASLLPIAGAASMPSCQAAMLKSKAKAVWIGCMGIYTDRPISRLEIIEAAGRRRFSDEAKLRIVAESYSGARLESATARKHGSHFRN